MKQPTQLIALIDRIIDVYNTPSGFLENWAAHLESEADLMQRSPPIRGIDPKDISTKKEIAAILQKAADDIDRALGIE